MVDEASVHGLLLGTGSPSWPGIFLSVLRLNYNRSQEDYTENVGPRDSHCHATLILQSREMTRAQTDTQSDRRRQTQTDRERRRDRQRGMSSTCCAPLSASNHLFCFGFDVLMVQCRWIWLVWIVWQLTVRSAALETGGVVRTADTVRVSRRGCGAAADLDPGLTRISRNSERIWCWRANRWRGTGAM